MLKLKSSTLPGSIIANSSIIATVATVAGSMVTVLISDLVFAANLARPNTPVTSPSPQRSVLPTAPKRASGQIGGATTESQRSIGSIGGPLAPVSTSKPMPKNENAALGALPLSSKANELQK